MKIRDAMTTDITRITPETSLQEAAQKMQDKNTGFMPVCEDNGKLEGVLTDRDIVMRAVAKGLNPKDTPVAGLMSDDVVCCFADDGLEAASNKMRIQGIYRIAVLSNPETREFCGVISLGDILRHGEQELAASTARSISSMAA